MNYLIQVIENTENINNILAIITAIGGMLAAGWKILTTVIPLYLSSNIEIALMSKREHWKYSCVNIVVLTVSFWIMDIGTGWLCRTENIKKIFLYLMIVPLVGIPILIITYIVKQIYAIIKKWNIVQKVILSVKMSHGKTEIKNNKKKKNYVDFYTLFLFGIVLLNITVSGAVEYEQGILQMVWVSTILTVFTIEVIIFMICRKKQSHKAKLFFFHPQIHKKYIYFLKIIRKIISVETLIQWKIVRNIT